MSTRWPVRHPGIGVLYYDSEEEARVAAGTAGELLPPSEATQCPVSSRIDLIDLQELAALIAKAEAGGDYEAAERIHEELEDALTAMSHLRLCHEMRRLLLFQAGSITRLAGGPRMAFGGPARVADGSDNTAVSRG